MYKSIELFAGCWWLALWAELAGFEHLLLNDFDKYCVETLKLNRPEWNSVHSDVTDIDFKKYLWKVDLLTGWYPCQSFSYAWKKRWLDDSRWNLFLEFARAIKECMPKVFVAENVRWLVSHDWWKTLKKMLEVFSDLWYRVEEPKVLKAINYRVPQKRERVFIIGIREDIQKDVIFERPKKDNKIYVLKDALKKWILFDSDVPNSPGQEYSWRKKEIIHMVPPWGYWRDLPEDIQKEYMMKSYYLWWGKTWMARRIARNEPSLTLLCSPAQKQTERCHPEDTRPFTVREYARIQTFPDSWIFSGSINQQYKQIWNAVPVNLWNAVLSSVKNFLDKLV